MTAKPTSTPIFLSWPGLICALGNDPATIVARMLDADREGLVINDQLALVGARYVGAVSFESQPIAGALAPFACRNNQLLLAALQQIRTDVDAVIARFGTDRVAVVLGTSTSGISDGEIALRDYLAHGEPAHGEWPRGYDYRRQEIGSTAEFLARYLDLGNLAFTVSTACSSSAHAFASARNLLLAGLCDAVLVGGVDTLCQLTLNGFGALESVSAARCTPFEAQRDGITIGEGAALFVMTREPAPLRLAGVGASSDAHHMSAPHPDGIGAEAAMRAALADAGLTPAAIDYINLHGTATPKNDAMESTAVAHVFGAGVPCSSTKALTGHTLGAAGAVEAALCALLMSPYNPQAFLPPQRFVRGVDPALAPLHFVAEGERAARPIRFALSNSFAFGGNNVALILARAADDQAGEGVTVRQAGVAEYPPFAQLVPHAAPMVLVDRVLEIGESHLLAEVDVHERSPFMQAGKGVPAWVGIEYLAQSVAAWAGYQARQAGGLPQFGFLLGSRRYEASQPWFATGSTLEIRVDLEFRDSGLAVFRGVIRHGERVLVQATINVFQPPQTKSGEANE